MCAKLIQDLTPYSGSMVHELSEAAYEEKGLGLFDSKTAGKSNIVPNRISNSFPQANTFARLVKLYLDLNPHKQKINVIELGAGSGLFSKHFLISLKDLGIAAKVNFIISDYSTACLENIKNSNILFDEFITQDEVNVSFKEIDIVSTQDFESLQQEFQEIDLCILNYVFCQLPLTLVKPDAKKSEFLELHTQIFEKQKIAKSIEKISDKYEIKYSWHEYKKTNELKEKYKSLLPLLAKDQDNLSFYSYGSLAAMENLIGVLADNGVILTNDLFKNPLSSKPFVEYGFSVSHSMENDLFKVFVDSLNADIDCLFQIDRFNPILRTLIFKNASKQKAAYEKFFVNDLVQANQVNLWVDLIAAGQVLEAKDSANLIKVIDHELSKLDSYSSEYFDLKAHFANLMSENAAAEQFNLQAQQLDYLSQLDVYKRKLKYKPSKKNIFTSCVPFVAYVFKLFKACQGTSVTKLKLKESNAYPALFLRHMCLLLSENQNLQITYCAELASQAEIDEVRAKNFFNHSKIKNLDLNFILPNQDNTIPDIFMANNTDAFYEEAQIKELFAKKNASKLEIFTGKNLIQSLELEATEDIFFVQCLQFDIVLKAHAEIKGVDFKLEKEASVIRQYIDLLLLMMQLKSFQSLPFHQQCLQEFLKLDDYSFMANYLIGRFLKISGKKDEAIKQFKKTQILDSFNLTPCKKDLEAVEKNLVQI